MSLNYEAFKMYHFLNSEIIRAKKCIEEEVQVDFNIGQLGALEHTMKMFKIIYRGEKYLDTL